MKEELLHYIWKHQLFVRHNLTTNQGDKLEIIYPGILNTNAGPDFLQARIRIDNKIWAGNIEIHLTSSEWIKHKHQDDPAYNSVILHVVWKEDLKILLPNGNHLPSLSLEYVTPPRIPESFENLTTNLSQIPCINHWDYIKPVTILNVLERSLAERVLRKAQEVLEMIKETRGNWEETFYRITLRSFGMKVNDEAFYALSCRIPYNLLRKHKDNQADLEALLFGTAGFLRNEKNENYPADLKKRFDHFKIKYNLRPMMREQWRFLRTRPDNFPTIRIAQFASLLHKYERFFDTFSKITDQREILEILSLKSSSYWQHHRQFGKITRSTGKPGQSLSRNVIINAIVPALFAYAEYTKQYSFKEHAIYLLETTSPEDNRITRIWEKAGKASISAFESQAKLELFKNYCEKRKCLQCGIGTAILK